MAPPPESRNPFKSRGGARRVFNAIGYSAKGIAAAFRHEAAFRQELGLFLVLTPLAIWLPVSAVEHVLLLSSMLLVLIVELLNSAIEALADRLSADFDTLVGRAKDLGSAAVLISFALVAVTWGFIGLPALFYLLR